MQTVEKKLKNNNLRIFKIFKIFGLKLFFIFSFNLLSINSHAQLSNFTLQVTKTDENCPGNGTLTFSSANTAAGATINYKIYKLPNLTSEIANLSTNFLGGLSEGTYRVIATQSLGAESNTQTQEITINNIVVPLVFGLSSNNAVCGNDGSITVTATSGTAVFYEIFSGPVIVPLQPSGTFPNLPAGTYSVRIHDNCGQAQVETRTILSTPSHTVVGIAEFPDAQLPGCDLISTSHQIVSNNDLIMYPLQYEYTVYPPDGGSPTVITGTQNNGSPSEAQIFQVIPFYHNQPYSYDLEVVDACGTVYNVDDNVVNEKLTASVVASQADCGQYYLTVAVVKFLGPYTITFTQIPPSGFVPSDFNTLHPGPFTAIEVMYGSETVPVPMGNYAISVTDACGRTSTSSALLEAEEVTPVVTASQSGGCSSTTGNIKIEIPNFDLETVTVINAPEEYPHDLPHDVSNFIDSEEGFVFNNVPAGTYDFILIDTCGNEYPAQAIINTTGNTDVGFNSRPDCEIGKGSIRIRATGSTLTNIELITAPAGFPHSTPYNMNFDIAANGIFSTDGLIPGNYTFTTINDCGSTKTIIVTVPAYNVTTDDFELIQHCGSFDFFFNHVSNGVASQSFWLQKLDPITNMWGHPATNIAYSEGTIPTAENSMALTNNATVYSLPYIGTFRILKRFETFENGSIDNLKNCYVPLHEFTFTGELEIIGLESLTCNGTISDVRVLVNGAPPFTYRIILKNGEPFLIDNGTNDIFTNLDPAVYKFEVTDGCGEIRPYEFDVALLPSLVVANQPEDFILCDDISQNETETFLLSSLDAAILGNQSPANYSVAYYLSATDAASETSPLPNEYISGNQQIFARINYSNNVNCFAITDFNLVVKPYPIIQMSSQFGVCEGNDVTVTAASGFDSYEWSDGQTGISATFSTPGIYTLTYTREYDDVICEGEHEFEVIQSNAPTITEVTVTDWTDHDNMISVFVDENNIGDYVYSLDNINFQEDNTFYGLETGPYTVYVKDRNGCGPDATEDVFLLTYPKYFTPNADGTNDFWRIKFSSQEPNMMVYIFDRYGKLITGFGSNSNGWDGNLNGHPLPSTDYWFVVKRESGKEHRGHFAMKR